MVRDLMPERNLVQLTNRIPIAHLAIERGLKTLISDAGGNPDSVHALNRLYQDLAKWDGQSAAYLSKAFKDAVKFFGYNVNTKGLRYFRSLDDYLSKVGTDKAFEELRYWAIGQSSKGPSPIPFISPPIHRELLCSLRCILVGKGRETMSHRVEREIARAMFDSRDTSYGTDDTGREQSVRWYKDWLFRTHATPRSALEEAVTRSFAIRDDNFTTQTLREAYSDLRQSTDPAVQYFVRTLTYLPEGSQRRNPGATPRVEWLNKDQTFGKVVTPAGTCLGFIEKYADGGWGIEPLEEGLVQETEIARSQADAKHYLVNRLTRPVTVTIHGESKQLRIASDGHFLVPQPVLVSDTEDWANQRMETPTYDLEFWDANHGLSSGEEVALELQSERNNRFVSVIDGTVTAVAQQKDLHCRLRSPSRQEKQHT